VKKIPAGWASTCWCPQAPPIPAEQWEAKHHMEES
jgi:hypothetical protein